MGVHNLMLYLPLITSSEYTAYQDLHVVKSECIYISVSGTG